MSDESKPSPQSSDSPSASDSSSRDALDQGSARELGRAIHGHTQRLDDIDRKLNTILSKSEFREGVVNNTLRLNAEAMTRQAKALEASNERVERALRLNREVVTAVTTEERRVVDHAVRRLDETGKNLLLPRETDEQVVTRVVVTRVAPWVARRAAALKIFAAIATGVGAVWAALKAFVHRS